MMTEKREYDEVTVQVPVACERAFVLLDVASEILRNAGYDRFATEIQEIENEIGDVHIPPSKQQELMKSEIIEEFLQHSVRWLNL